MGAVLGPTLPYLAKFTQTSFSQISLLFIARSLGYLAGSFIGGYLYDRVSGISGLSLPVLLLEYGKYFRWLDF